MDGRILIIMTSGPDTPRRCATPFFMATIAAAMDYDFTVFSTIDGSLLLKKGATDTIFPKEGSRAAGRYPQDALQARVKFKACTASMERHGPTADQRHGCIHDVQHSGDFFTDP
jgi:predicted peroxiredoxin